MNHKYLFRFCAVAAIAFVYFYHLYDSHNKTDQNVAVV